MYHWASDAPGFHLWSPCCFCEQALVEHYAALGQPEAVERCVLQMDIASLDFNQIVKLCRQHRLLSALAYILNRGLNDFVSPAAELLLAMLSVPEQPAGADAAGAASMHHREAAARKLLAYLRCCFRGEAFPPGTDPVLTQECVTGVLHVEKSNGTIIMSSNA